MNDLQRAALKFKDWVEPGLKMAKVRILKEGVSPEDTKVVVEKPKRSHKRKSITSLRADQYQTIWRAIQVAGYTHQSHMYSGDGSLDKMYTEMANQVADVVVRMMKEPNLVVGVSRVKGGGK